MGDLVSSSRGEYSPERDQPVMKRPRTTCLEIASVIKSHWEVSTDWNITDVLLKMMCFSANTQVLVDVNLEPKTRSCLANVQPSWWWWRISLWELQRWLIVLCVACFHAPTVSKVKSLDSGKSFANGLSTLLGMLQTLALSKVASSRQTCWQHAAQQKQNMDNALTNSGGGGGGGPYVQYSCKKVWEYAR